MNKINTIDVFCRRLNRIGVKVELVANYPWVYIVSINGDSVKERYMGNHGFTAFWFPVKVGDEVKFTNRQQVFSLLRRYLTK